MRILWVYFPDNKSLTIFTKLRRFGNLGYCIFNEASDPLNRILNFFDNNIVIIIIVIIIVIIGIIIIIICSSFLYRHFKHISQAQ